MAESLKDQLSTTATYWAQFLPNETKVKDLNRRQLMMQNRGRQKTIKFDQVPHRTNQQTDKVVGHGSARGSSCEMKSIHPKPKAIKVCKEFFAQKLMTIE